MTRTKEAVAFIQGQWLSFDRVLQYLNTLENRNVDKHIIYGHIMQMRPTDPEERETS